MLMNIIVLLAMGIYNLQYAYDPSMIIIGGAISHQEVIY